MAEMNKPLAFSPERLADYRFIRQAAFEHLHRHFLVSDMVESRVYLRQAASANGTLKDVSLL
jgi:hypothetical protein